MNTKQDIALYFDNNAERYSIDDKWFSEHTKYKSRWEYTRMKALGLIDYSNVPENSSITHKGKKGTEDGTDRALGCSVKRLIPDFILDDLYDITTACEELSKSNNEQSKKFIKKVSNLNFCYADRSFTEYINIYKNMDKCKLVSTLSYFDNFISERIHLKFSFDCLPLFAFILSHHYKNGEWKKLDDYESINWNDKANNEVLIFERNYWIWLLSQFFTFTGHYCNLLVGNNYIKIKGKQYWMYCYIRHRWSDRGYSQKTKYKSAYEIDYISDYIY